jgi:hypothetical protein
VEFDAARALYKQGLGARGQGDHATALASFREAQRLLRSPVTGLAVAQELLALGRLLESRQEALDVEALPHSTKETEASDSAREQARGLAASIRPRLGTLRAEVAPTQRDPSVVARLDSVTLPLAALQAGVLIDPGAHVLEIERHGRSERRTIDAAEGQEVRVDIPADVAPASTPPPSPPMALTAPAPTERPRQGTALTPVVWTAAGVAALGLAVGAVTGVEALVGASALKGSCTNGVCPQSRAGDLDAVRSESTISTVSLIVAGVGALTGACVLILGRHPTEASAVPAHVRAWVGAGALGLGGQF